MTRKLNRVYVEVLTEVRNAIDEELGEKVSVVIDEELDVPYPDVTRSAPKPTPSTVKDAGQTDIMSVAQQMIETKNIDGFFKELVLTEITNLREWCGGKSDLTAYNKADVVGYVRNCLPYIPKNRSSRDAYSDKTLKECVELTKANPSKYIPISHRTCENRFAGMGMVLNFAKEYLGIVNINLATLIDEVIRTTKKANWVGHKFKEKEVANAVRDALPTPYHTKLDDIMDLLRNQVEYQ